MRLSGEATLNSGVDEVYAALNDPAILVRTIPGCQRLEQVGADSYRASIVAGVASIKGTFDGDVRLTDQDAPHSFTLHASGVGAPGTVSAVARVTLTAGVAATTRLTYEAEADVGGVIGGVGQRMITGVARKTAGEFFAAVDRELSGAAAVARSGAITVVAASPEAAVPGSGVASGTAVAPGTAVASGSDGPALVWTKPVPAVDPGRQRMRDLLVGATFGAVVALLGVLVGAIIVTW